MPTKLNLKETPSERSSRLYKSAKRAAKKRRRNLSGFQSPPPAPPPRGVTPPRDYLLDEQITPPRSTGAWKRSRETEEAEEEERAFRERLFDAMGQDTDADYRASSYEAYVPSRWGGGRGNGKGGRSEWDTLDEEAYAEAIRKGMWERTHADDIRRAEEAERRKREKREVEDRARQDAEREERARLAKLERRKGERAREERAKRVERYWAVWGAWAAASPEEIEWADIPWPSHAPEEEEGLGAERIGEFLFGEEVEEGKGKEERRRVLREQARVWHPDKFEGRYLARVRGGEKERERVKEAVGRVARGLLELMKRGGG